MQCGKPLGATRVLGKSQGFLGLSVRDEVNDQGIPYMVTVWEPTPGEIAKLSAGARVEVLIMGTVHPPIRVEVGEVV